MVSPRIRPGASSSMPVASRAAAFIALKPESRFTAASNTRRLSASARRPTPAWRPCTARMLRNWSMLLQIPSTGRPLSRAWLEVGEPPLQTTRSARSQAA